MRRPARISTLKLRTVQRLAHLVERQAVQAATWQQDLFGPPSYEPAPGAQFHAELARRICAGLQVQP